MCLCSRVERMPVCAHSRNNGQRASQGCRQPGTCLDWLPCAGQRVCGRGFTLVSEPCLSMCFCAGGVCTGTSECLSGARALPSLCLHLPGAVVST